MTRPTLLDLYCGDGGAGVGYFRAGFDVIGVDVVPRPEYPFPMLVRDALEALTDPGFLDEFDVVHASPPCPRFSAITPAPARADHPDLLAPTLALLDELRVPWIVENVPGAPMRAPLVLCGAAFGLGTRCHDGIFRPLRRHRLFDSSVPIMGPGCLCDAREPIGIYGTGGSGLWIRRSDGTRRGYKASPDEAREALGTPWISRRSALVAAIPPAYTQYVGEQILPYVQTRQRESA